MTPIDQDSEIKVLTLIQAEREAQKIVQQGISSRLYRKKWFTDNS